MARRLSEFPSDRRSGQGKYPWGEWTDGSVWEIRRGEDYYVATENMRVNLHMRADSLLRKVRTKKFTGADTEGLVFQFIPSEEKEAVVVAQEIDPQGTRAALEALYTDAVDVYERAREEVTIERSDGKRQKYAAVRYKQQIDRGYADNELVPTLARIVRRRTTGFGHLEDARRPDLMVENLIIDPEKPYHSLWSPTTIQVAKRRMDDYYATHPPTG